MSRVLQTEIRYPIAFNENEKQDHPISVAIREDGSSIVINRYSDNVWDFWPYIPQENRSDSGKRLTWHIKMPDGCLLTHPKHSELLLSAKDFAWSLFAYPVEGRPTPKMSTIISKVIGPLAFLLKWMVSNGIHQFRHIQEQIDNYVVDSKKKVQPVTAFERLLLLEDLYRQSTKISDALTNHPWPFESAAGLTGQLRQPDAYKVKTPLIPDITAKKITEISLQYFERAPKLFDVIENCHDAYRPNESKHYFSIKCTKICRMAGFENKTELNLELQILRTSCYIIIAMFSGLRDSEVMSLTIGCIGHSEHTDGTPLIWLHGTIYKNFTRKKKWQVPPIVEKAVRILERLTQRLRLKLIDEEKKLLLQGDPSSAKSAAYAKRLAKVRLFRDKLFLTETMLLGRPINVLSNSTMHHYLRDFCDRFQIFGEDGKIWPLSSHQFRRTFAHFYAKSEMGDLLMLQEHFGHAKVDTTLGYAHGGLDDYTADTELLEDIAKAKQEYQLQILNRIVGSDSPLAAGDHWIGDWRRTVRTAKNRQELIDGLSGTLSLTGTGHSWCAGSAKGTGCGSRCMFEPDMCTECKWAIITIEHLPVWKEIAKQQETILACTDIGDQGKSMAQRILQKAYETINKLEAKPKR